MAQPETIASSYSTQESQTQHRKALIPTAEAFRRPSGTSLTLDSWQANENSCCFVFWPCFSRSKKHDAEKVLCKLRTCMLWPDSASPPMCSCSGFTGNHQRMSQTEVYSKAASVRTAAASLGSKKQHPENRS